MKQSENILKGYFTTLAGVATVVITLVLIYMDKVAFVYMFFKVKETKGRALEDIESVFIS